MKLIGHIERSLFSAISKEIATDEVIITEERIAHIRFRHPNDYERFQHYMEQTVSRPDYIIRDKRKNTAILLKAFEAEEETERVHLILRLVTAEEQEGRKNSVITFWKVREKEYRRMIRNREVLYKRE